MISFLLYVTNIKERWKVGKVSRILTGWDSTGTILKISKWSNIDTVSPMCCQKQLSSIHRFRLLEYGEAYSHSQWLHWLAFCIVTLSGAMWALSQLRRPAWPTRHNSAESLRKQLDLFTLYWQWLKMIFGGSAELGLGPCCRHKESHL